jgi:hypothetical protein
MFWFTRKPSSGSHSQYSAKITHLVQCRYIELVQDIVIVMAAYYDTNKMICMEYINEERAETTNY